MHHVMLSLSKHVVMLSLSKHVVMLSLSKRVVMLSLSKHDDVFDKLRRRLRREMLRQAQHDGGRV
jgi:hypothetical protein